MSLSASTLRIHCWLGWLVGLQVLIWVSGGLVSSLVPFTSWVKGGDTVKPPSVVLPAGWAERVTSTLRPAARRADVVGIAAVATPLLAVAHHGLRRRRGLPQHTQVPKYSDGLLACVSIGLCVPLQAMKAVIQRRPSRHTLIADDALLRELVRKPSSSTE